MSVGGGKSDEIVLPLSREAPGQARAFVRSVSTGRPHLTLLDSVLGDAELLVSEVVTNAVLHGRPPVRLGVVLDADAVLIRVGDSGPHVPWRRDASADDEGGRGMELVDSIADTWGVDQLAGGGKVVWFRLLRTATPFTSKPVGKLKRG